MLNRFMEQQVDVATEQGGSRGGAGGSSEMLGQYLRRGATTLTSLAPMSRVLMTPPQELVSWPSTSVVWRASSREGHRMQPRIA